MVLDIRNFATFSEHRPVDEVGSYVNTLWSFMVKLSGVEASERIPSIVIRGRRDPVELFRLA